MEFDELIASFDWGRLRHAYGRATDTPGHLAALHGVDQEAVHTAVEHLDTAVLHQGFASSATAPAARVVASLVDRSAVEPGTRDILVQFLGWVAQATVHAEGNEAHFGQYLPALRETLEQTFQTVWAFVGADNPDLRMIATTAAVWHARTETLAHRRPVVAALLRERVADGEHRSWHVGYLAKLDGEVAEYLTDVDPDVRIVAALAPSMAGRADATAIIVEALAREHAEAGTGLPAGDWRGYSLTDLVKAVVDRVTDFDSIADSAAGIVRAASWTGFDRTWGPLVLTAFRGRQDSAQPLSATQRTILGALLENRQLWERRNGSVGLVFKTAHLPHDPVACRRIYDQR